MHCISAQERYKQSQRTSKGAEKWLDMRLWKSTSDCLAAAKKVGFKVVAATLAPGAVPVDEVDWTQPTAFVLGNEREGALCPPCPPSCVLAVGGRGLRL